jgi:heavy metal sensor kinase
MRSIRFSLLVCFLALLALSLGAFSYLFYENSRSQLALVHATAHKMLVEDSRRSKAVIDDQFHRTQQVLHTNQDAALLLKAQTMASQLAERYREIRRESVYIAWILRPLSPLITAQQGPGSHLLVANVLHSEAGYGYRTSWLLGLKQLDLQFVDDVLYQTEAERSPSYYQVYSELGELQASSSSLKDENLPLDFKEARNLKLCEADFNDIVLPSGKKLRCVTIRVPIVRLSVVRFPPRRGPGSRSSFPPNNPPPTRSITELRPADPEAVKRGEVQKVFLLYAKRTTEVEETLVDLRAELESSQRKLEQAQAQTLSELDEQSRTALASLRTKLLLFSLGVFGVTAIGGVWLVRRGLAPLDHLAAAVSQVSERDFQLRLDQKNVPDELQPIVERLQQALSSLEQAFAREKQATADISHDLRTPIASLLATAQVSLRKQRTPEEYRSALETCRDIGTQLSTLVERLLALSRLDAGADRVHPELVDIPELAEQCVTLVRPLAEQKGLNVSVDRNGPIVMETDPGKLREVLTNLLDNAIQYNRPQGRVELAVDRSNGHVQLEVRDTGIGIAPEAKPHLFERFYRVDPSRQCDTTHSGLGLAIVKGYVDLLGGKIEVESVPGAGSTFRVLLPLPAEDSLG